MKKSLLLVAILLLSLATYGQMPEYQIDHVVGIPLKNPQDVYVDKIGNIFIADYSRVIKLNALGIYQMEFDTGQDGSARGIVVDRLGNIYVSDPTNTIIQKYDSTGQLLQVIDIFPVEGLEASHLTKMTIDRKGFVYIAFNNRIKKLDENGNLIMTIGLNGPQDERVVSPNDVDVDLNGNIYVSDLFHHKILKYDSTGKFILKFGSIDWQRDGSFSPSSIAVSDSGDVVIADIFNFRFQKYNSKGDFILNFGGYGFEDGLHLDNKYYLDVDDSGNIFMLESGIVTSFHRIYQYDSQGNLNTVFGPSSIQAGKLANPWEIALDMFGNYYVATFQTNKLYKYSVYGQLVYDYSLLNKNTFMRIEGLAVDKNGNLFVLECDPTLQTARVQKFNSLGQFISKFDLKENSDKFIYFTSISINSSGSLYISTETGIVKIFSPEGKLIEDIDFSINQPAPIRSIKSIAIDKSDNLYILGENTFYEVVVANTKGNLINHFFPYGESLIHAARSIAVDAQNNIYIGEDFVIQIFNSTGNVVGVINKQGDAISINSNNHRLAAVNTFQNAVYILVPSNLPPSSSHFITGTLFNDLNNNCRKDSSEVGMAGIVVTTEPGPYYGVSDENGQYSIQVDTGSYTVRQILPQQLGKEIRQVCPLDASGQLVHLKAANETAAGIDFGNEVTLVPFLSVNVSSDRRRRCFTNNTTISYSNSGFAPAADAQLYVQMPEHVVLKSADKPYVRNQAGQYVFELGTLAAHQSGTIQVVDSVVCGDESIRSLTVCTKAWITPANAIETSPDWDQADISVEARCLDNGFVRFAIRNTGQGSMADSASFRIYLDAQLALNQNYRLVKGDSLVLQVPANGRTTRLEADQSPHHPRKLRVTATVEGCGRNGNGTISTGFVNALPPDDAEPELSVDCKPIIDSYDPNDKLVTPAGVTAAHFTPTQAEFRYQVRFQNTGTDIAYRVVVVDTLSEHLELASLKMTNASHPYQFSVSGKGRPVLTWTFDNINLPDSARNQEDSNGFVQFSIKPKAGLPEKTLVENYADIFFDYNSPVRTNTVENRLYDIPLEIAASVRLDPEQVMANTVLTDFSPTAGRSGALVTLTGKNFGHQPAQNQVFFNGVLATVIQSDATVMIVRVPAGAVSGKIRIQTADGASESNHDFVVFQAPTITGFTPQEGLAEARIVVTITGTHFSPDVRLDTVLFNGNTAVVLNATTTSLTVEMPASATSGRIRVATLGGSIESSRDFVVWHSPNIRGFSPQTAKTGAIVTLTGNYFAQTAENNVVKFGDTKAEVLQASYTQLLVKVPADAHSGKISVQTPGGVAMSADDFVFLPAPVLVEFSPKKGVISTVVRLSGYNFGVGSQPDTVFFHDVPAKVLSVDANNIMIQVPRGAHSGKISIAGMGGKITSNEEFVVEVLTPEEAIQVYPNPNQGRLVIDVTQADFKIEGVQIFNSLGQLVYQLSSIVHNEDKFSFNLPDLRPGMLVVLIQTEKGAVVKKIMR